MLWDMVEGEQVAPLTPLLTLSSGPLVSTASQQHEGKGQINQSAHNNSHRAPWTGGLDGGDEPVGAQVLAHLFCLVLGALGHQGQAVVVSLLHDVEGVIHGDGGDLEQHLDDVLATVVVVIMQQHAVGGRLAAPRLLPEVWQREGGR